MAKVTDEYLPLSAIGAFPEDWQEKTLSQVCLQVTDGTHDSPKPVLNGGYPLVTGKAIKGRRIDFTVTYNISDEDHRKVIDRSKPEADDILFANIGNSIGDLVRVLDTRPFSIKNVALFKPNQTVIYPRYLEYYMLSEQVQDFIKGSTRGSAQPFIGLGSLRGFPIALPPLGEQRNIADLLGALDDRITLLHKTNATLEAMAQALFKSWFVDFDPVRAKQEGRTPEGMGEATASLFPNSFEESELGLVPKGWSWGDLTNFATFQNGYAFRTKDWQDDGNPVVKIGNVKPSIIDITGASYVSANVVKDLGRFMLRRGDLLVGMTGYVGETGLVPEIYPPAYINQRVGRISTSSGVFDLGFVYCLARNPAFKTYAEAKSHGSAQANVSGSDLMSYPCIIPSSDVLSLFNQTLNPTIDSILSNYEQAQTLAALRDTLLPLLISGQLRLQEPEALLEEITQ